LAPSIKAKTLHRGNKPGLGWGGKGGLSAGQSPAIELIQEEKTILLGVNRLTDLRRVSVVYKMRPPARETGSLPEICWNSRANAASRD